jgi:adenylylsulfate kinase
MTIKILIMGLPGSGKTYLAQALKLQLEQTLTGSSVPVNRIHGDSSIPRWTPNVRWFNADEVRTKYNDWDFSHEGRIRQSLRMADFALNSKADFAICDFVAPLSEQRNNFKADWTIWMDTIDKSRYEDTNQVFVAPEKYDFRITEKNAEYWAEYIGNRIIADVRRPEFDWRKETVQMLGRWQPWHSGHRALFERLLQRTGQVIIQIRDVQGWQNSNPFSVEQVKNYIRRDLDPLYQGQYEIMLVPNIVHIGWGRGVGYTSGEETFDESITSISATSIRKKMGLE